MVQAGRNPCVAPRRFALTQVTIAVRQPGRVRLAVAVLLGWSYQYLALARPDPSWRGSQSGADARPFELAVAQVRRSLVGSQWRRVGPIELQALAEKERPLQRWWCVN
jgi:hypothetical protein